MILTHSGILIDGLDLRSSRLNSEQKDICKSLLACKSHQQVLDLITQFQKDGLEINNGWLHIWQDYDTTSGQIYKVVAYKSTLENMRQHVLKRMNN